MARGALGSFLKHAIASFVTKSLAISTLRMGRSIGPELELDIRLTSLNHEAFTKEPSCHEGEIAHIITGLRRPCKLTSQPTIGQGTPSWRNGPI
ncbi:hypothetical protein AFLA_006112 [Aspergillus flavus NRRL3357]|nr:hypothetical protein AFLA_006112 [Aspergillus flavus NRRL3357]